MTDYEGVSVLDIFIFGSITTDFPGDESDMNGFFFGVLKSIR